MNAEAKTLADELRTIARCIYIAVEKTVADDIAGKATKAADFLDRLSAPGEGVGLTRYEPFQGQFAVLMETSPEGEWVRFEDATAALAAKEAERAEAERQRDEATALVERLRGRIEALEAGLRPFSRIVDKDGEKIVLKWGESTYSFVLFPKHFYTASALLSEPQASEGRPHA